MCHRHNLSNISVRFRGRNVKINLCNCTILRFAILLIACIKLYMRMDLKSWTFLKLISLHYFCLYYFRSRTQSLTSPESLRRSEYARYIKYIIYVLLCAHQNYLIKCIFFFLQSNVFIYRTFQRHTCFSHSLSPSRLMIFIAYSFSIKLDENYYFR